MKTALIYTMPFLIDRIDFSIFAHIPVILSHTVTDQLCHAEMQFLHPFGQYQDCRMLQLQVVLKMLWILQLLQKSDQSPLQLVQGNLLSPI